MLRNVRRIDKAQPLGDPALRQTLLDLGRDILKTHPLRDVEPEFLAVCEHYWAIIDSKIVEPQILRELINNSLSLRVFYNDVSRNYYCWVKYFSQKLVSIVKLLNQRMDIFHLR